MSTINIIGIIFSALFSGFLAWSVFESDLQDKGKREGLRYQSFLGGINLPVLLMLLLVLSCFYYSLAESLELVASSFFGVFLHIGFYNMLLLMLLPLFRKHISARACACLWMVPNILYLSQTGFMSRNKPIWVISLSATLLKILIVIWLAGFVVVFVYKICEHLIFRHQILKNATPVCDEEILELWKKEQKNAGLKKQNYKLVCSPDVKTPLSIGLWKKTTRVVLPRENYSSVEFQMIFRHELVHICRSDAWTKFSLLFCTAVCWFNPFMWVSMRKSFDDLELSCDETVLIDVDEDQRRQYAHLLLKTAGQEQGFSTCLSASASALRYRLRNTVKPRRLHSGAVTVGIVSFLLLITCGSIAFAYDAGTGKDVIFLGQDPECYSLSSVQEVDYSFYKEYICTDPSGLKEYLYDLPIQKLTGNYDFNNSDREMVLMYDTPNGSLGIDLNESTIVLTKFWGEKISQERFYIPGSLNWNYLNRVIPKMPGVDIQLNGPQNTSHSHASLVKVTQVFEDHSDVIKESLQDNDSCTGVCSDYKYQTMVLNFQEPPLLSAKVTIFSWDWKTSETIPLASSEQEISLPADSVHITISASFEGPDTSTYEAIFRYDIQVNSN